MFKRMQLKDIFYPLVKKQIPNEIVKTVENMKHIRCLQK